MSFIVVGTNHKYSPVSIRERLSFSKRRLKDAVGLLKERGVLSGAVILSTCNRVEIYASGGCSKEGVGEVVNFISHYHVIDKQRFSSYLYIYEEEEANKHLYSVACGLDSLILGETQILGQVKFALSESENTEFVDEFLKSFFNRAISFAGKIHRETRISEGKLSIGSVAIDFIKEKKGILSGKNILIIGIGKVTELVLKYLQKERPNVVFISNRTFEKAKQLAAQIGAKAVRFDNLGRFLREADIVISATASPHFIIRKDTLEGVSNRLLIIDLALPRDVDPQVKELKNVRLYSLEDMDSVIKKNVEKRSREAEKVKGLINIEVERLWKKSTELEPELALLHLSR